MSFSPVLVSNNVLKRAFDEGVDVSPMKLQKILYFAASEFGKKAGKPMLSEAFQVWKYGPVVRSVYDEYKSFGGSPIRAYAKDAEGKARIVNESKYPELHDALDRVWRQTRNRSAVDLSRITHLPGAAWTNAWSIGHDYLSDDDVAGDEAYVGHLNLG